MELIHQGFTLYLSAAVTFLKNANNSSQVMVAGNGSCIMLWGKSALFRVDTFFWGDWLLSVWTDNTQPGRWLSSEPKDKVWKREVTGSPFTCWAHPQIITYSMCYAPFIIRFSVFVLTRHKYSLLPKHYSQLKKLHQHVFNFLHHQPMHYYAIISLQAYFHQKVTSYLRLYFQQPATFTALRLFEPACQMTLQLYFMQE